MTPFGTFIHKIGRDIADLNRSDVILPNLKHRLSGVTSTVIRLYPVQRRKIAAVCAGPGLPKDLAAVSVLALLLMRRQGPTGSRVWHARRNSEMLLGLVLKFLFGKQLKLLFTSASQRVHSAWTKFLINRMDHVVATSQRSAKYLTVPNTVIRHGIDTTGFHPDPAQGHFLRSQLGFPHDAIVFGCFGRVRHQKGTDIFIDAMIDSALRDVTVCGIVMGRAVEKDRAFLEELRTRVSAKGLQDRIRFLNEVPPDDMSRWYNLLDVYVAPQRWEGFGLTPLEAMACGVPVIATRVGAFEEMITDRKNGLLVDPDNLGAMQSAATWMLLNPESVADFGKSARQTVVEEFDLAVESDALIAIYQGLLGRRVLRFD